MEKSPNHQVQSAVHDPEDMDTDRNELCSTGEPPGVGEDSEAFTGRRSAWLSSKGKAAKGGPEDSVLLAREDVAPTKALSETLTMGKWGRLTSGMKRTPDGLQRESPGVGEDSETFTGRQSVRLSNKGKAAERGPEHTA